MIQHHSRRQRGVSLLEASITLAVCGVLLGSVLPGWQEARQRRALEAASAQLNTDLHLARSLAVAHGRPVRLRVDATRGCYVIHTGAAAGCTCDDAGRPSCQAGAQALRSTTLPDLARVRLSSSSAAMLFDADRGTVTPTGTLRLSLDDGRAVHHVVNIMGRVRTCSPEGRVPGHAIC